MAVTYPNQYIVTFAPEPKTDANNPYHKVNTDVLQNASNDLTKIGSVKLWMYLTAHSGMKEFGLSRKACEEWGIKKDSYYQGQKELEEKGYLKPLGPGKYEFTQFPIKIVTPENVISKPLWDF